MIRQMRVSSLNIGRMIGSSGGSAMSFRTWIRGIWSCAVVAPILGCGLHVGEKAPQPAAIAYSGKSYSCVAEIPQHIEKYVKDELNDQEISEFMRCLQNAFTSFAQYTRG